MHYSLLYISQFAVPVSSKTLDDIRTQSALLNQSANVSGLLLSTPGYFCQFLQGSRIDVEQTMLRISKDSRHREIATLLKTDLPETLFPGWGMATSLIPAGDIATEIELAYRDRLADLSAVDRLMSIMQRFRPLDGVENPAVVIDSEFNKELALTKLATNNDAVQGLLELGKAIFTDCDIALAIREPGDNGYSSQANTEADQNAVALLINQLPNRHFTQNAKFCSLDHNGSLQWSPSAQPENPTSAITTFPNSGYIAATGIAVTDAKQEIIGALWTLSSVAGTLVNAADTNKLTQLALSIAEQIELRRVALLTDLQKQTSQRQQLNIAANLRRLEAVVNVASSAIVALDRRGRILMINDAARKLFGFHSEKVPFDWPSPTGFLDPGTLIPVTDSSSPLHYAIARADPEFNNKMKHAIKNKLFARKCHLSNDLCFLRVTATEVDEIDSAIWSVLVFDDVTALESGRERIRRSDRLEALGQLTGGIAHDFNNILATIQSSVELAKTETDQVRQNQLHDIAITSVERGAALTNRLITFALANPTVAEVHSLTDVMQSLLELAESGIAEDINLTISPFSPSVGVKCDAGQLENALLNILINSRDAIRDSGVGGQMLVEVNVIPQDQSQSGNNSGSDGNTLVEIVLSDDGPGMSEEVIRRATDPFFSTKRDKASSGLGLSMVYGFVQQSGGELLIKNLRDSENPLSGTQITLTLEYATKEPPAPQAATDNHASDTAANHQTANILLVEDEPELARVLELTLRRSGHNLQVAHNGHDARMILQSDIELDLLLTDIVLPGAIDGYALAKDASNLRPELRVVYLSGYAQQRSDASLLGPVLSKPVSTRQLMAVVQRELQTAVDLSTVES